MSGSVSNWIIQLKEGDADAARRLWFRYSPALIDVCRKRLSRIPKGHVDEDDIAQSVFRCICRGLTGGQFDEVADRHDLWYLLVAITMKKVAGHVQTQMTAKRGGGKVHTESSLTQNDALPFRVDQIESDEPAPEVLVILQEEHSRLLDKLRSDSLRSVAEFRIAGYTVAEIAGLLSLSQRSIERKLQLIRDTWKAEVCEVF